MNPLPVMTANRIYFSVSQIQYTMISQDMDIFVNSFFDIAFKALRNSQSICFS